MLNIFVYGTLKPGEANYRHYCQGKAIEAIRAYTSGELYDLPLGYPALTFGERQVWGVLLKFKDPEILISLDRLEDYEPNRAREENQYERLEISIYHPSGQSLGRAWAYLMARERIKALDGKLISSGCWPR